MAFVNEYISDEDMKKYNLIELMDYYRKLDGSFHPFNLASVGGRLSWTIDKERNIWLLNALSKHLPDHRDGWTGEVYFILYYQGRKIEVVLNAVSTNKATNPIQKTWRVLRIKEEDIKGLDEKEIFKVLQEALSEYGLNGLTDDSFKRVGIKKPNVIAKLIVKEK